jgi:hypothetical protein
MYNILINIEDKMCAQYNPCEMIYFDSFKVYNDELYALEYPDEWIMSHKKGTGPECYNCIDHASWRGVFIGYCGNCATAYEDFSRGPGFCGKAVEHNNIKCPPERSAYNTYLKNANLENIGSIDFNPCHTIHEHIVWKNNIEAENTDTTDSEDDETYDVVTHIICEGFNIREELEQNPEIKVGHYIEYVTNNQCGWCKYKVIDVNGKKDIKIVWSNIMI